jgi:hypothetical protein
MTASSYCARTPGSRHCKPCCATAICCKSKTYSRAKAILRTRPIYHSSDAAIRGHVFCSFLALMLQKELTDLCQRHGLTIEWADLLRNLDRLQEATIAKDGKRITTRIAVAGQVGSVFQAAGIALPPNLHERAA